MYRFEAASRAIREAMPPVVTEVFGLVTELGGGAFLLVFLSVLYWVDERESTATVIGYALVALAVTLSLKTVFALPRPPESAWTIAVDPDSYGFPSGHAIAATVVYGGLLLARSRVSDSRTVIPVVSLVVLLGLSRVVVGVHYLGDVLAGFAIGGLLFTALWWSVVTRADHACLVAAACALPALLVTGGGTDSLLAIGGSLGGVLSFHSVDMASLPTPSALVHHAALVCVGLPVVGGLYWLASTAGVGLVAVVGNALAVASVVTLPALLTPPLSRFRTQG